MTFTTGDDYNVAIVFNSTELKIRESAVKIAVVQEPHNSEDYIDNEFLTGSQLVILHDPKLFPGVKNYLEFPSLMFYSDRIDAGFFLNREGYEKKKKLSFVLSAKNFYVGHRNRLSLLDKILRSDLEVDIFGRGLDRVIKIEDRRYKGEIENKYSALLDYEYSLALENSYEQNYLTEKFIDCIVCNTIPIYAGAPNVDTIYHKKGFVSLDISSPTIIEDIANIIDTGNKRFAVYNSLNKARYFSDYNMINVLKAIL